MIGYNGFNNGLSYNTQHSKDLNAANDSQQAAVGNYNGSQYGGGNSYAQNQVLTASPEQILIMLFDAAIRFNREAQAANDTGNISLKLEKIGRVFNIISELSNTLDHKIGGEIAEELEALYQFNLQELGRARNDSTNSHLKFVEKFLLEWRDTWSEVIDINRADTARRAQENQSQYNQNFAVAG